MIVFVFVLVATGVQVGIAGVTKDGFIVRTDNYIVLM